MTLDPRIVIGSRWRHHKGGTYRVVGQCTMEAEWAPGVLYVKTDDDPMGEKIPVARLAAEFFDGRFVEIEPR